MTTPDVRCINLDWLECACLEPCDPRDIGYFEELGLMVLNRGYGTRVYAEMFTILDADGEPFLEIRRRPLTPVLSPKMCSMRLHNRACYLPNAAKLLADFITEHDYEFSRIIRVDICLDFPLFDSGDDPMKFVKRYLSGKYSKINQANISAHGRDDWEGRSWNSLSWGAPTSAIGTKFYNKTMELYDQSAKVYRKPYIRYAWMQCGFIDDLTYCTKRGEDGQSFTPQIWRLEFSIRSAVKGWFVIERDGKPKKFQSIRNTLRMYQSSSSLLLLFASLCRHYFRFKVYQEGVRKDRCPDKELFNFSGYQRCLSIDTSAFPSAARPADSRPLASLRDKLDGYLRHKSSQELVDACQVILKAIDGDLRAADYGGVFSKDEILALQKVMYRRSMGDSRDPMVILSEVKELLHLSSTACPF